MTEVIGRILTLSTISQMLRKPHAGAYRGHQPVSGASVEIDKSAVVLLNILEVNSMFDKLKTLAAAVIIIICGAANTP